MKRKAQSKINNSSGQITVEYILLGVVLILMFQLSTRAFRDSEALKNFHETPNNIFVNLIENGNWEPDEDESRARHPNQYYTHRTPDGKGS